MLSRHWCFADTLRRAYWLVLGVLWCDEGWFIDRCAWRIDTFDFGHTSLGVWLEGE